ncbi:HET-domain-containing protein [Venturia nashicola]|uniref:HET-domain-containing protein n=1 Tax=Venturia nashicola TaxID=86259 RepID=A0A4Z1PAW0_9PEZI|nr:HET-domain-containing protein [Venturia nashicola]TLD29419.1 HET-domain-containing protein [Venturia nashicola]
MQFKSVILALCLSTFAIAKGHDKNENAVASAAMNGKQGEISGSKTKNSTHGNSEEKQCSELSRLTKLVNLVNNATKLTELETKHNMTADKITKLKASAANATSRLTELQSNTTLTSQCAVVDAGQKLKGQCKEIKMLTNMMDVAGNTTALSEMATKKNWTDAQVTKFKARAANATTKLNKLKSNSTLVNACATIKKSSSSVSQSAKSNGVGQVVGNVVFTMVMGGTAALLLV